MTSDTMIRVPQGARVQTPPAPGHADQVERHRPSDESALAAWETDGGRVPERSTAARVPRSAPDD